MGIRKYSKEEELKLVEDYIQGAPVISLMEKYGFKTKKSITDKVKKYFPDTYKDLVKIARNNRKDYSIDLSSINCEFNAYFIGLMLTDGYIQDDNKFGIQLTDEDCIKFIASVTNKTYKTYPAKDESRKILHRIIFSDSSQIPHLARYGIVPNKTHIIQAPKLTKEERFFIPYIIRGIIDGDGCVYSTCEGTAAFYICTMSKDFAYWIKEQLENTLFMRDIEIHQQQGGIWLVETALQTTIYKLITLVYDNPFGMTRKYNKCI